MPAPTDIRNRYAVRHIPNGVFYIPFAYYAVVRAGTLPKMLSWALIYLFPTFYYGWLAAGAFSWHYCLNYLLLLLAAFSIYELGYIHNDTFATRREAHPALRLYPRNLAFFSRNWQAIFALRILYALAALAGFLFLNGFSYSAWITAAGVLFILPLFLIYNYWRSPYNAFLYPVLVFSRYLPFLLPYPPVGLPLLFLFLSFPCVNMLERFSMPRYRFPVMRFLIPTEESKTLFRVCYYLIATLFSTLFCYIFRFSPLLLLPLVVLFLYRLLLFFFVRRHTPRNYLQG